MRFFFLLALFVLPISADAVWFDPSWTYRVPVEIAPGKVGATTTITNFPVYVDLGGMPSGFWDNASSTGADVRVTESDGQTETPFEIVFFNSSTERGELHFLADSLSTTSTSTFYVYYGNSGASAYASTTAYGSQNVWTSYSAVYHFQTLVQDSTANNYTLTNTNTVATGTGQLSGSGAFFGTSNTNKKLTIASNLGVTGAANKTMSVWFKPNAESTVGGVSEHADTTNDINSIIFYHGGVPSTWFDYHKNGVSDTFSNRDGFASSTIFSYGVYRYNTAAVQGRLNTTNATAASVTGNGTSNVTTAFTIGQSTRFGNYFSGYTDEVRFSSSVLSDSWLLTEYNNQSSTSTFMYIGAQEEDTGGDVYYSTDVIWFD